MNLSGETASHREALERLEPDEAKVSSPVLRGEGDGNVVLLPDTAKVRAVAHLPTAPTMMTALASLTKMLAGNIII